MPKINSSGWNIQKYGSDIRETSIVDHLKYKMQAHARVC